MALIDTIDGIPAYSTIQEALNWGSQYNITTYHTHLIAGEIVYMAGATHADITAANLNVVTNPLTPSQVRRASRSNVTTTFSSGYSSGGSSSSGGGY